MSCWPHPGSCAVTPRAHSRQPIRTEQMKEWTIKDYGRSPFGNGGGTDIAAMAGDANGDIAGQVADVYRSVGTVTSIEFLLRALRALLGRFLIMLPAQRISEITRLGIFGANPQNPAVTWSPDDVSIR